jgi:hypothetical protein
VRRFPKDWWFPIASSHGTGYRSVEADKFVRSEDVGLDVLMVAPSATRAGGASESGLELERCCVEENTKIVMLYRVNHMSAYNFVNARVSAILGLIKLCISSLLHIWSKEHLTKTDT